MKKILILVVLLSAFLVSKGQEKNVTCLKGDCTNGKGSCRFEIANHLLGSYSGEFVNGKFDGRGEMECNLGNFKGKWRDGQVLSGEGTIYFAADSIYFKGKIEKGKFQGIGEVLTNNGQGYRFVGTFKDGRMVGEAKGYAAAGSEVIYEGNFDNCMMNGYGELKLEKEGTFKGNFVNNRREGLGSLYNKDNILIYEGNWIGDSIAEKGKMASADGISYQYDKLTMSKTFVGGYSFTLGNNFTINRHIAIMGVLSPDYTYSGKEFSTMTINGKSYSSELKISGFLDKKTKIFELDEVSVNKSDRLPYGLFRGLGSANFQLMKISSKEIAFVLDGEIGNKNVQLYTDGYIPGPSTVYIPIGK